MLIAVSQFAVKLFCIYRVCIKSWHFVFCYVYIWLQIYKFISKYKFISNTQLLYSGTCTVSVALICLGYIIGLYRHSNN